MKISRDNVIRIVLLALILATLVFIAVQSLLPPETSQAESDKVGEIIEEIIPPETPEGEYVQNNIRSIGHFVEFALLGFEVALYVFLFERKLSWLILVPVISPVVALLDESLQYLSDRGPEIKDVWVDVLGFVSLYCVTVGVSYAVKLIIKRMKSKNGENNIG